jgi:hypothetical protein
MTPQEKAKQLVKIFQFETEINEIIAKFQKHKAKQCALIAVDELIEALDENAWQNRNVAEYYKEVKHEIEKL